MPSIHPLSPAQLSDQAPTPDPQTMQAVIQSEYGSPDVLRVETVAKPVPKENEVLVRVRAASVDAGIWHLMRGTPFLIRLMFGGLRKPKISILGSAIAGEIDAVGAAVTQYQPGDEIFADLSESGLGGFAEYACAPVAAIAPKPKNLSFEAAATVSVSGLAALQGLRDLGQLQPGQKVLILGASGGVGSFAVQMANAFGAEVTAVCGPKKIEMMRQLGVDSVIDCTQADVTKAGQQYDVILDAAAYRSFYDYLPVLTPRGIYVMVGGSTIEFFTAMLLGPIVSKLSFSPFSKRQLKCLTSAPNPDDLLTLRDLLETGQITPIVDRCYPLQETADAIRYVENRQVKGKVTISIG